MPSRSTAIRTTTIVPSSPDRSISRVAAASTSAAKHPQGFPSARIRGRLWDNRDGDKDESILGLSADSDWALISNYNDKAVIRNKQPFDTMYDLDGEGSAMREKYVEVFFRQDSATGPIRWQDYRGIYCLTERIKRHDDRVNIDKLEPCDNVLTGNPAVDDQAVISGGYIFRKDKDPQINPFTIGSLWRLSDLRT